MSTQSILISEFSSASTWYCEMIDSLEIGSATVKEPVASSQQPRARSVRFSNIVSINNSANTTVLNGSGIGQAQSTYQQNIRASSPPPSSPSPSSSSTSTS
ncbi:hypothetical protein J3Q64DRAFT_1696013 [Phycomyces blakesleeanus]|uniref:Uncharacterized protein n=1 Tax=Phycomyces blakesleeanus TaxID=4837 RepID=A0ABR3B7N3_PHYBL